MALTRLLGRPGRVPSVSQNRPLRPVEDELFSFCFFSFSKVLFIRLALSQSLVTVERRTLSPLDLVRVLVEFDGVFLAEPTVHDFGEGAIGTESAAPKESRAPRAPSESMSCDNEMLS